MGMAQAKAPGGQRSRVTTLRKRAEFLRVRKGVRWAGAAFVLEGRARGADDDAPAADGPRFGFTVTRQTGKAVERNRIRRRLKAAVQGVVADHARGDFDYVVIARRPALTTEFATLAADLVKALGRLHKPKAPARGR
jgi:ribonuclease P protein component